MSDNYTKEDLLNILKILKDIRNEIQAEMDLRVESRNFICDFCSSINPPWVARCEDFSIMSLGITHHSEADFMVCDACKVMIEAQARTSLLAHSMQAYIRQYPGVPDEVLAEIRKMHEGFWNHYLGEIVPITEDLIQKAKKNHKKGDISG